MNIFSKGSDKNELFFKDIRMNLITFNLLIYCNIPLVSIGTISIEGAPENNVHETHYVKECFTTQCQSNTS